MIYYFCKYRIGNHQRVTYGIVCTNGTSCVRLEQPRRGPVIDPRTGIRILYGSHVRDGLADALRLCSTKVTDPGLPRRSLDLT